jgi:predicted porin
MFYASVHQEVHNDAFGASINIPDATVANNTNVNARSRDMATRASGEVRFSGPFAGRVTVDLARLHYVESGQSTTGKFQEYKKTNWAVGAELGTGPWRFATQYVRAGAGSCRLTGDGALGDCNTAGLQAWMVSLGARYRFDRQTFVYVIGNRLNNGPSARHDNWATTATPNRGEDVKQAAIGISYSF